jgi:hypothetical protein
VTEVLNFRFSFSPSLLRIFINFNGHFPITEENCSDNFIRLQKMIGIILILLSKDTQFLPQMPQCYEYNCQWHLNLTICHFTFDSVLGSYVNYFVRSILDSINHLYSLVSWRFFKDFDLIRK